MDALVFIGMTAFGLVVIFLAMSAYNRARDSTIMNNPHENLPEDYDE